MFSNLILWMLIFLVIHVYCINKHTILKNILKSHFMYPDFSSKHDSLDKFIHLSSHITYFFKFAWVSLSWKTTFKKLALYAKLFFKEVYPLTWNHVSYLFFTFWLPLGSSFPLNKAPHERKSNQCPAPHYTEEVHWSPWCICTDLERKLKKKIDKHITMLNKS